MAEVVQRPGVEQQLGFACGGTTAIEKIVQVLERSALAMAPYSVILIVAFPSFRAGGRGLLGPSLGVRRPPQQAPWPKTIPLFASVANAMM